LYQKNTIQPGCKNEIRIYSLPPTRKQDQNSSKKAVEFETISVQSDFQNKCWQTCFHYGNHYQDAEHPREVKPTKGKSVVNCNEKFP